MSEDEFPDWAQHCEERHELVEGVVVMHAGATRDHERIAKRIFVLLYAQVDEARFDVNKGDFGVRIRHGSGRGGILYPDVVVDRQSDHGAERAPTPIVVIEVLSASTDVAHHVEKLGIYARRDTLIHYAVFEQSVPRAYCWTRGEAGWPEAPTLVEGQAGTIAFASVDAMVRLAGHLSLRVSARPKAPSHCRQYRSHKIYYGTCGGRGAPWPPRPTPPFTTLRDRRSRRSGRRASNHDPATMIRLASRRRAVPCRARHIFTAFCRHARSRRRSPSNLT